MIRTTLVVDGRRFALAARQDVPALKEAVRDAVRDGGDLVEFTVAGDELLSVLVTPGVPLLFEELELEPESDRPLGPTIDTAEIDELEI